MLISLFTREVGKNQQRAMLIRFATKVDHSKEEGYRYYEIAIHAPMNYVGVYGRRLWSVVPIEGLSDDEDGGLKPGFDYDEGAEPFECFGYHDSGWRDVLERKILDLWPNIEGFARVKSSDFTAEGFEDRDFFFIVYATDLSLPSPR